MRNNSKEKLIVKAQVSTLNDVLKSALNYHYTNFIKLEKLAEPYGLKDRMKLVDAAERLNANTVIKFEVQAYLNHLRRFKHFINHLQKNGGFNEPTDVVLNEIWRDILDSNGMINFFANKWAVHRSIDDPRGESEDDHLSVLLNLEQVVTFWNNGHLSLSLRSHTLELFDYHLKVMKFIDWVFAKIDKRS